MLIIAMGEKDALDLSAILIMIGIFIPVVIEKFYSYLGGGFISLIPSVSLHYLSLAGFYILIYCLVYLSKKDDIFIRTLLIVNIALVGFVTILLSNTNDIFTLSPTLVIAMEILIGITFTVLPIVIFFVALFKLMRSWWKKIYGF